MTDLTTILAAQPDTLASILCDLRRNFKPVNVQHGRKFRGLGYVVDQYVKDNGGFSGSGVRPLLFHTVFKVWDPARECYDYYNSKHQSEFRGGAEDDPETVDLPQDRIDADLTRYANKILEACAARCGSDLSWRANYLRKVLGINSVLAEALAQAF